MVGKCMYPGQAPCTKPRSMAKHKIIRDVFIQFSECSSWHNYLQVQFSSVFSGMGDAKIVTRRPHNSNVPQRFSLSKSD